TGLLYLARWFWWRVTAWSEIAAMVSSFGVSLIFLVLARNGIAVGTTKQLLITIAVTTICWVATAYLGPQTDREVLHAFFDKVQPRTENFRLALVGWVSGCAMIWSALFTVGNILYGRQGYAAALFGVFILSGLSVLNVVRKLWR